MGYLQLNADAAWVILAQCAGQLRRRLAQPLLAIHRRKIGDDLLLVRDTPGQIAHETLRQGVAA